MTRKHIETKAELEVLVESRRRCAFCFGLHCDTSVKKGQIAHIDRDNSNAKRDNLVFLCLPHHDEYDSKTSQSKGLKPKELKHYNTQLLEYLAKEEMALWTNYAPENDQEFLNERQKLPLEIFRERIAIYRVVRDFLGLVMRDADVDIKSLFKFARDTDEVIFLFDQDVSVYLREIYKKGVELRYTGLMMRDHNNKGKERSDFITQNTELVLWFAEQIRSMSRKLSLFLSSILFGFLLLSYRFSRVEIYNFDG